MKKNKDYVKNYLKDVNDDGFSLIELVVAVGILAILSVVGLIAYSGITENARKTAAQSAADEVYKGAVAYDANSDDPDAYKKAAKEWKDSAGNDSIEVEIKDKSETNGEICVVATMEKHPEANTSKGPGCETVNPPITGGEDNENGENNSGDPSNPGDGSGNGGEDDPGVITSPATAAECFDFNAGEITDYDVECGGADVVIPNTINGEAVVGIGGAAFYEKGLTSVVLNKGLETIGGDSFYRNSLTGSIVIPSSVKTIEQYAFAYNGLASVEFNEGLETIGYGAFEGNALTSVEFPSTLKTIENFAFCFNNLTSVKFNESLKSIGSRSFYGNDLSSVRVSNNTEIINEPFLAFDEGVDIIRY